MAYEIEPIHTEKGLLVQEFFVNTADDNYITARWCFVNKLHNDYSWLAVHALEKYMKAMLLLNGRSVKRYSHNIVPIYGKVKCLAPDLLPDDLKKPDDLETSRWRRECPDQFVKRLYKSGNPDNRYQISGLYRLDEDLFKLDLMVYALRRLCVPLDAYLPERGEGSDNLTYREMLIQKPEQWRISEVGNLEKTVTGRRGKELKHILLNLNFRFSPKDYEHCPLQTGMAARNPVLMLSVIRPLEQEPDSPRAAVAAKVCDWLVKNIRFPRKVKKRLRDAKAKWKATRRGGCCCGDGGE